MAHDAEKQLVDVQRQVDYYEKQYKVFSDKVAHYEAQREYTANELRRWKDVLQQLKRPAKVKPAKAES
jgi:septation ring formation regulator EzrA